ncbi:heme-binding protein [Rhizobium sp. WYCCWR 11146]|uniref:GlcG/HbpS family heme-binding protein n=1 Tax=Rhizobium sp. WYCCWR 11146 TaxID=2749833 RepID=UPI0015E70CE2|nr:heme-binding protein [Rhizobium sp. WYCCWR 11146]MBA1345407.1 heme-binding protein [Rhizobium sp. WYCCWR 11146]
MSISNWTVAAAIGVLSMSSLAHAEDEPKYGTDISVDTAKVIAAAAVKECAARKWSMAIAVTDTHGALVYYEKMDDTELGSAQAAQEKAAAAALYKRPTRAFYDVTAKAGPFMLTMPGVLAAPGAWPVVRDGKIIGAMAASGGTGDQDDVCAKAGLAAM